MADIKLTSSFDPSGIIQGLQQLRTKLRGLTSLANVNPANLAGFNNDLAQAEQKAEAINKMIGKGFSSKQDIQTFTDLNNEFNRLTKSATKFMQTMGSEAFSHVSNEIATNFNAAMQSVQQTLDDTQAALKIKMQELGGVFSTKEMQNRIMSQISSGRGLDEIYDEIEAGLKGKLTSIPRDTGARTALAEARGFQAQGEAQVQAYKDLKTELKTLENSIRSQAKTEVAAAKTRYGDTITMGTVRNYDPISADTIMDSVTRIPGMDAENFGEWVLKALANSIVGSINPEEVFQKFMGTKLGTYNGRARYGRDIMPVDIDQQNTIRAAMSSAYMATPIGQAYANAQSTMQQRLQTEATSRGAVDFEALKTNTNDMIQQWSDYVKQMKTSIKGIERQANIDITNEQKRTAAYSDLVNFQNLRAQQSQPGGLTALANTYTQALQQEAQAQQTRTDAMQDASDKSRALKTDTQTLNQVTETGVQTNINGAKALESQVSAVNKVEGAFGHLMSRLQHFFSIYTIYNKIRQVVRQTFQDVQNLDKAFASIAMVTSKTVENLWSSYSQYAQIANKLGQSTEDAIKTSALYYQQGLETNEVLQLTESTMKLATLAAQDFETSTQELTAAIRAFHMEMSEGEHVTDVYSELAAHAAADVSNIAAGMSKVASIASSAGSSFENTAAFITQIIETTQESGVNAGTALKTIVARFTELKENVDDAEESFEDLDYNKIDKALKTVGISLKDEQGQIRDFDDLIIELSGIWDTLSRNQQRYIATVAAGSRQQSRFIALLEDHDRLMELIGTATDSAGRSNQQFAKYADTINYRLTKLKNTWEQFRVSLINERTIKNILDKVQSRLNKVLSFNWIDWTTIGATFLLLGKFVAENLVQGMKSASVGVINLFNNIANFIPNIIAGGVKNTELAKTWRGGIISEKIGSRANFLRANGITVGRYDNKTLDARQGLNNLSDDDFKALEQKWAQFAQKKGTAIGATFASAVTSSITAFLINDNPIEVFTSAMIGAAPMIISAGVTVGVAARQAGEGIGMAFTEGLKATGWGLIISLAVTAIAALIKWGVAAYKQTVENEALSNSFYKATKELEKLEEAQEKLGEQIAESQEKVDKASEAYQNLADKGAELQELKEKIALTTEEQEKFNTLSNEIAEMYPELVTAYTAEGNAVINLGEAYKELVKQKQAALQVEQTELNEKTLLYSLNNYSEKVWNKEQGKGLDNFIKQGVGQKILSAYNNNGSQKDIGALAKGSGTNKRIFGAMYQELLKDSTIFSEALSKKTPEKVANAVGKLIQNNEDALEEFIHVLKQSSQNMIVYDQEIKEARKETLNNLKEYANSVLQSSDTYVNESNKNVQKMMAAYAINKNFDEEELRKEFLQTDKGKLLTEDQKNDFLNGLNDEAEGWLDFYDKKLQDVSEHINEELLEGFNRKEWKKIYSDVSEDTNIGILARRVLSSTQLSEEEKQAWYNNNKVLLDQFEEQYEKLTKLFNIQPDERSVPGTDKTVITGIGAAYGRYGKLALDFENFGDKARDSFVKALDKEGDLGGVIAQNTFLDAMDKVAKELDADTFAKVLNEQWEDFSFIEANTFWENVAKEIDDPEAFELVKEVFSKYFVKADLIPDDFTDQLSEKAKTYSENLSTYTKVMKSAISNGGLIDYEDFEKIRKTNPALLNRIMDGNKLNQEEYTKWIKEQEQELENTVKNLKNQYKIEIANLKVIRAELETRQAISLETYKQSLIDKNLSISQREQLIQAYSEDFNETKENIDKMIKDREDLLKDGEFWKTATGIVTGMTSATTQSFDELEKANEEYAQKVEEANKKVADSYQNILDKQKDLVDKQKELNDLLYGSDTDKSSLDPMYNYTQKIDYLKEQIDEVKDSLNDSTSADPQQSLKQWADNLHQLAVITDAASNTRKTAIKNIENSLSNGVSNWLANSEYGFDTNVSDFYRYNPAGFYEYNYDLYARMPKETKKFVDEQVKQMNELLKADKDAQKELKNQSKAFTDYQKKVRDDYISLQDKVVDMLKEKYQEEIDDKKEMYEALEKADNDYLDALQKAIDKERKLRDKQKKWDDLATKEKKLSLMRRDTSGANQKDIQSLEEEIQNDRQQLLDDSVDDVIDSLKEFYETQKESRDAEIEYQQSVLDNANLMKEAIDTILGWKSLEDMQAWMAEHTKNFENLSDETVIKMQEDWAEMYFNVQEYNAATQEDIKEIFDTTAEEIQEEMNNTSEALTKEADRALKEMTQSVEKSITSAEDAVTNAMKALTEAQEAYNKAIKDYNDLIAKGPSINDDDDDNGPSYETTYDKILRMYKATDERGAHEGILEYAHKVLSDNSYNQLINQLQSEGLYGFEKGWDDSYTTNEYEKNSVDAENNVQYTAQKRTGSLDSMNFEGFKQIVTMYGDDIDRNYESFKKAYEWLKANKESLGTDYHDYYEFFTQYRDKMSSNGSTGARKYGGFLVPAPDYDYRKKTFFFASGGLVNYTGPAWVDGTKSKPEAFLSAEDTKRIGDAANILRDIFIPWSMSNDMQSWMAMNTKNFVNSLGDSNIEININVDSIATEDQVDYLINRMKDEITEAANPIGTTVIRR